jgi:hypothetical protein
MTSPAAGTSTPGSQDSGVTAVLLQMQALAERFGQLDGRENDHHRDVSEALIGLGASFDELRSAVTGQGQVLASLDGISGKLAELAAVIEPLLPPEPGPVYHPAPAPRWWSPDFSDEDRDKALAKLRNWVELVYRGQYGHLAGQLGDCWDEHPLCLIELDWAAELWQVLYLRATRTPGVLTSQAEYGTRILPALAEQLATETTGCRHQRAQVAANGWAGAR